LNPLQPSLFGAGNSNNNQYLGKSHTDNPPLLQNMGNTPIFGNSMSRGLFSGGQGLFSNQKNMFEVIILFRL
jgi:hypothetical protein